MANEELIYNLTRAVYEQLGASANEQTVESLVTDIYRIVEPLTTPGGSEGSGANGQSQTGVASGQTRDEVDASERAVVSVFGVDRPGIVAGVAQILAESECSIVDINQTVVAGKFAMVLIADTKRSRYTVAELKERFRAEGERLGVRIYAQREDLFNAMHRV